MVFASPGITQKLLGHQRRIFDNTFDDFGPLLHFLVVMRRLHFDQRCVSQDAGQPVVEIVRDAPCQRPDGLHLLGLQELIFKALFFFFQPQSLGRIAYQAAIADGLAVRVQNQGGRNIDRHGPAVASGYVETGKMNGLFVLADGHEQPLDLGHVGVCKMVVKPTADENTLVVSHKLA